MIRAAYDVAIVGAGIIGLAHAWAACKRGLSVLVLERDERAVGASVRNFGLGLVVGQAAGDMRQLALASRDIWFDVLPAAGCWHKADGSLIVARDALEMAVLQAFQAQHGAEVQTELRSPNAIAADGYQGVGGLYSPHEIGLDARAVLPAIARWLAEKHGVQFIYAAHVHAIDGGVIHSSRGNYRAERTFVCAGHEFQTLYPAAFATLPLRRCALQMQSYASPGKTIAPALMTGLSTLHYPAFADCPPLAALRQQVAQTEPLIDASGIHLIVHQVGASGDLIVGDSHDYSQTPAPFTSAAIDQTLQTLAETLLQTRLTLRERWQGVYASSTVGTPYSVLDVADNVRAIVISSGVGMSIGWALAERSLAA